MPFNTFNDWLFDGNLKSPIPQELLKSTSPISNTYVLGLFQKYPELNFYLNGLMNNVNLYYIKKDELFLFAKKMTQVFKVYRGRTFFRAWPKRSKLINALERKIPYLKKYELELLCQYIEKSSDKDSIYTSLGLVHEKKKKLKKKKNKKISLKKYLAETFSVVRV